jgi:hypothetical protein
MPSIEMGIVSLVTDAEDDADGTRVSVFCGQPGIYKYEALWCSRDIAETRKPRMNFKLHNIKTINI